MTIPLSKDWPVPTLSSKFRLPWVDQIFDLRNNCNEGFHRNIPCITHVTLEKWNSMTAQDIRGALHLSLNRLSASMPLAKDLPGLKTPSFLKMTSAHMCLNLCGLLLKNVLAARNFSITRLNLGPRNLTRRCPKSHDIPVQILDLWSQKYDAMLLLLRSICSKL